MVRHAPPDLWFDPNKHDSRLLAAMSELRHLCTRAEHTVPLTRQSGSRVLIKAIMSAIDDYAECETGHREFFWDKPHSIG
jgi:hypothetical protein